jgi:polyisoprenyl-teichoic acid--peptidoglycan teichoic acid transferase
MRDFQDFTKERRAAHRRWWLWSVPVVLAGLILGIVIVAGPVQTKLLGNSTEIGPQRVEASPTGWIQRILGGDGRITDGPLNVLVLGVDTRPDDEEMGSRTDTIMLVQVMPKTGDVKLLSVPRDLLVEVEPGVKDRINAAYNYGGIDQTITALENCTDVPIEHYAIIDFEGFSEVISTMGGVKVDVGHGEFPEKWHMGEGVQRLGGRKALFYARYRGTPGGDLDRMERQRELVAALRSKALRWNTVKKMPETIKVMDQNVQTDLGVEDAISLGRALIRQGRHAQMTSEQLKGTPETLPNGNEVLVPDDEANDAILDGFRY